MIFIVVKKCRNTGKCWKKKWIVLQRKTNEKNDSVRYQIIAMEVNLGEL